MRTASLPSLVAALLGALISPPSTRAQNLPPTLDRQLERIFGEDRLQEERFGPSRWLAGGEAYATLEDSPEYEGANDLVRYETATGRRSIVVDAGALVPAGREEPLVIEDYALSEANDRILVFTNSRKVWRRNTRGDFWVLDLATGRLRRLGGDAAEASLMFAKLSPDGERAGYVRDNDLFVEEIASGAIHRLTAGGSATRISGTADWVYEEELGVRDGWRFSPDGKRIAFWEIDTAGVGIFTLIDDTSELYPTLERFAYPKVGTVNPAARVGIVAVPSSEGAAEPTAPTYIDLPGDPREHYVARLDWVDASTLVLQQLNRLQNRNDVFLADAGTGAARRLYRDENEAWLDVVDRHVWIAGGGSEPHAELLWLSERDGWRRAYAIARGSGADHGAARAITTFDADVIRIVATIEGDRPGSGWLYVLASPNDPTRRSLYRAPLDGGGPPARITPRDQRGWHDYDIAPNGRWAIHTVSTLDRPPRVELIELPSHRPLRTLVANDELEQAVADLLASPAELFRIEIEPETELDAWMIRPPDFDPERRYPLLVYVYGEPAGQTVVDRWSLRRGLFHRALAQAGWVIASFDNRGTPAPRGAAWRKVVYGAIGELSADDQAAAVRELLASSPFLDPERVAIWGWSGGGSNTLNALFRHPEIFEVGISVAPVPDQRLYDTIYQERYMGLPDQNADGYRRGSPIHFAEGLSGRLLLVHGSGDDNVHYQGTERLVNRLIELGKPFDLMVYPNRSHSISEGRGTSLHLHRLIARYLLLDRW